MTPEKPDMVAKALSLLVLVGDSAQGTSATELAGLAGLPFSTTHRLLRSLAHQGFVAFDPASKRYALGIRVFQLGQRVSNANGLAGSSIPVLRSLTEHTREASILGVLDGDHVLTISKVDGPQAFRVTSDPGTHSPLNTTALGKVLLAYCDDPESLLAGIEPAATARLAQAVRDNGAAAVHALGAGAFSDWKTASALNRLIGGAFDAGCDKRAVAAELEVVGQLQLMLQQEFVLL